MKLSIRNKITVVSLAVSACTACFLCSLRSTAEELTSVRVKSTIILPEDSSEDDLYEDVNDGLSGAINDTVSALDSTDDDENLTVFEYSIVQAVIPYYFNLTDQSKKPEVRSQGNLPTCWAITACSAIESDLLPQTDEVFSPDHMSLQNGYQISQEDGGDYNMIMSYLADWKGPVPESEDPYGDGGSPEGLEASVHVHDMRLLRGMTRNQIKQMILTYGAAQSSLSMDRSRTDTDEHHYYQKSTSSYYDPFVEELNHDILILGWDDSWSRDNFRIKPRNDGAWICQNSWGEDFGEDGIFYVSYEDKNLLRKGGIVYSSIEEPEEGQSVYETDALGWLGRQGYGDEQCFFAGVFQFERVQTLTGIGFYTTGPYTSYLIYLVSDYGESEDLKRVAGHIDGDQGETADHFGDNKSPDNMNKSLDTAGGTVTLISAGMYANPGFHTADIMGEVNVQSGQKYAVVVVVNTWNAGKPVAVEMRRDSYSQNVSFEGKETYLSRDGVNWENTQEKYETNVCMKVFTEDRSYISLP